MRFEDQPIHRQLFARHVLAKAGVADNPALLAAFAGVAREDYLGPPPWFYNDFSRYRELASEDPVVLYQDMLVALDRTRHVNNGVPSLHAAALNQLNIRPGERVAHLGGGTGYYSAILSDLVGPSGHVLAVEYDPTLAAQARENLRSHANVEVVEGDATLIPDAEVDVIYANFALDHPPAAWIDHLGPGGRLLFPLGIPSLDDAGKPLGVSRMAGFLLVDRRAGGFGARFLQPVSFIWAEGQGPAQPGRHKGLEAAFRRRIAHEVRQLRWRREAQDGEQEWYGEPDWGLSKAEL